VENKAERPNVHLFEVKLEEILRQDDVFLHLGSIKVKSSLELSQLLLYLVSHQQRLSYHDSVVMNVKHLAVQ
jgi:hypothetical protein